MARIGWVTRGPFECQDDLGREVVLTHHSPAMAKKMLVAAVQRNLERQVASAKLGAEGGRRVCTEGLRRLLGPNSRLDAHGRGMANVLVCGGLWTLQRLADAGYQVDPKCQLCGAAP